MANPDHIPPGAKTDAAKGQQVSGPNSFTADPTNEPGQYPVGDWGNAIFGGPLPTGTGAPGSATGAEQLDSTTEKGQLIDGLTGLSRDDITDSGAPGTQGAVLSQTGGTPLTYTEPGDGILTYKMLNVSDDIQGPQDSTQANDQGYASGGPQLPGLKGNEPQAGKGRYQPGAGRVLRGGRAVAG